MRYPTRPSTQPLRGALVLAASLVGAAAHADQTTTISGRFGAQAQGAVAVNQAAGAGNAQANVAAMAPDGFAGAHIGQAAAAAAAAGQLRASIGGQAFDGTQGLLRINQASGAANTQSNVALIAARTSVETTTDSVLAATVSRPAPSDGSAPTDTRVAQIDRTAFRGASGLVQVNQSAGNGNSTGNAFVLQTPVPSSR